MIISVRIYRRRPLAGEMLVLFFLLYCSVQPLCGRTKMIRVELLLSEKESFFVSKGFFCHFLNLPWLLAKGISPKVTYDTNIWKGKQIFFFFFLVSITRSWTDCKRCFSSLKRKKVSVHSVLKPGNQACQYLKWGFSSKPEVFNQRPFTLPLAIRLPAVLLLFSNTKMP